MAAPVVQPLRYAKEIQAIATCPPLTASPADTVGFRFAFPNLNDKNNFLPVALIKPERIHAGQPITQCCSGYALSMYTSAESLLQKVHAAKKTAPNLLKRLGNHFVELKITASDGLCGTPNGTGHFDFFERVNFVGPAAVLNHRSIDL